MMDRRLTLAWVHGLAALALGFFLLGASLNFGAVKDVADFVANVLAVPEYPAVFVRETLRDIYTWTRDRTDLKQRLSELERENARLRIVSSVIVAEQIRAELAARTEEARVTLRDPLSWWNECRIDKGTNEGITVGLPVFQNGFLAGRVSVVGAFSSWVELLTSPALMIPVVVEETRELGIVVGDGSGAVLLSYIPEGHGVEAGMNVSTALVSELLPPGIPIGVIADGGSSSGTGYMTYRVSPGASISTLYTVSILKHPRNR
ncbi:MAG: rod shape-determining protein MreC [Synergistaceae bacterium]|jgi:rod shape-determining protein MreC|nr:rod shape-determining protein MreC [Synergistaceae bacterium]